MFRHHSLLLMNGFNKTEAAVFSCSLCFLRAFSFISLKCTLHIMTTPEITVYCNKKTLTKYHVICKWKSFETTLFGPKMKCTKGYPGLSKTKNILFLTLLLYMTVMCRGGSGRSGGKHTQSSVPVPGIRHADRIW